MNQIIAVALGGSFGAVFRFLVSTGIYQWLGRGFPYGTLVVNIIGSFLLGLLTEALVVQRISFAHDYRFAILIGFIGAFTTFSTFSLETFYLIEQGSFTKAIGNILISITACILAVWLGLLCSRGLFYGDGRRVYLERLKFSVCLAGYQPPRRVHYRLRHCACTQDDGAARGIRGYLVGGCYRYLYDFIRFVSRVVLD